MRLVAAIIAAIGITGCESEEQKANAWQRAQQQVIRTQSAADSRAMQEREYRAEQNHARQMEIRRQVAAENAEEAKRQAQLELDKAAIHEKEQAVVDLRIAELQYDRMEKAEERGHVRKLEQQKIDAELTREKLAFAAAAQDRFYVFINPHVDSLIAALCLLIISYWVMRVWGTLAQKRMEERERQERREDAIRLIKALPGSQRQALLCRYIEEDNGPLRLN